MTADFFSSFGSYVEANPNSFFGEKIAALFTKIDAPLNAENEHFKNFSFVMKSLYAKILEMYKVIGNANKEGTEINKKFIKLGKKIDKTETAFGAMNTVISQFNGKIAAFIKHINTGSGTGSLSAPPSVGSPDILKELSNIYKKLEDYHIDFNKVAVVNAKIFSKIRDFGLVTVALLTDIKTSLFDARKESVLKPAATGNVTTNTTNITNPKQMGMMQAILHHMEKNSRRGGSGILGTIIGWLFKGALLIGGMAILNRLLDNTDFGKQVKTTLKGWFKRFGDAAGKFIQDGKMTEVFTEAFKFVRRITVTVFGNLVDWFDKNGSAIIDTGWNIGKAFLDELVMPLWNIIKNSFVEKFKKQDIKYDDWFSIEGFLGNLKKSLFAIGAAIGPIILGWVTMSFLPIIGKPFRMLNSIVKTLAGLLTKTKKLPIKGINGNLLKLFGRAGVIGLIIAEIGWIGMCVKKMHEQWTELGNINDSLLDNAKKSESLWKNQTDRIKDKITSTREQAIKDPTEENILKAKLAEFQEKERALNEKFNKEVKEAEKPKWWDWLHLETKRITAEDASNREKLEKEFNSHDLMKRLRELEEKSKLQKDNNNSIEENTKAIKESEFRLANGLGPTRKSLGDGIIIEPHSKDQIMMTKEGGPIDLMMKDMIIRFDQMLGLLESGLGAVASITAESGNNIVQAVVSSGGNSGGSSGNNDAFSGSDPIRDLRDRAARASQGFSY